MIELPRAALVADEIAKEAQFFSFGTNDLTQTTFGFSRDDINKVLPTYLEEGILKQDPFAVLDQEGVGQLIKMATERGRKDPSRPESRHLRRARRRAVIGGVLPQGRTELRVLLALPRADGAPGGSASRSRRQAEGRRRQNEIDPPRRTRRSRTVRQTPCPLCPPWFVRSPAAVSFTAPSAAAQSAFARSSALTPTTTGGHWRRNSSPPCW